MKPKVVLFINVLLIAVISIVFISIMTTNKSNDISSFDLQEIREIAWESIERSQIPHITSNKNEAAVGLIDSKEKTWIMPTVTFNTDQDGLLGPMVALIRKQ